MIQAQTGAASKFPLLTNRAFTLGGSAHGVKKYLERYKKGETISPVLLIAGFGAELPVIIAEGYHRVSACWQLDEKTTVAVRLNPV